MKTPEDLLKDAFGEGEYSVEITLQEAIVLDRVLTLQMWEMNAFDFLISNERKKLRADNGKIIIGRGGILGIANKKILEELLVLVSMDAYEGNVPAGRSLKQKLFGALLGGEYARGTSEDSNQDHTSHTPEGSS